MLLQTEEMSAAAFQLGIEFEDIAGRTKTAKAENLVKRCDRNGQLPELRMLIDELIR